MLRNERQALFNIKILDFGTFFVGSIFMANVIFSCEAIFLVTF